MGHRPLWYRIGNNRSRSGLHFIRIGFYFGHFYQPCNLFNDLAYGITAMYQDKVVTVSILVDVVLFYYFIRKEWFQISRGILYVVICSVPVALYFY